MQFSAQNLADHMVGKVDDVLVARRLALAIGQCHGATITRRHQHSRRPREARQVESVGMSSKRRDDAKARRREKAKRADRHRRLTADKCAYLLYNAESAFAAG